MISIDWWWLPVLLYAFGALFALDAIWQGRTAQGTIAWLVTLLLIPMLGIPIYLLFGTRRFHGYRLARRRGDARLNVLGKQVRMSLQPFATPANSVTQPLYTLFRQPMTSGNRCQLLINGEQTYRELHQALEHAEYSICMQFYIVRDDSSGQKMADLLIKKAQQGVRVYFLYDEIGSHGLSRRYINALTNAGVRCSRFNSLQVRHRLQLNFRNHRKVTVIDGKTTFIGGLNLADEYQQPHWRDTHMRIDGPATLTFQLAFSEDWYWATQYLPRLHWQADTYRSDSSADSSVMCINTGPADNQESASLFISHLIHQAKHRIWLATPYFVPDIATLSALRLAGLRGIDVRILIPLSTDKWLVQQAMGSYIRELSACGARFFSYRPGFMHQKIMLIDEAWSSIGSSNLDNRSLRINFETNALIHCKQTAADIEAMLKNDFQQSNTTHISDSKLQRLLIKSCRLLAPIL